MVSGPRHAPLPRRAPTVEHESQGAQCAGDQRGQRDYSLPPRLATGWQAGHDSRRAPGDLRRTVMSTLATLPEDNEFERRQTPACDVSSTFARLPTPKTPARSTSRHWPVSFVVLDRSEPRLQPRDQLPPPDGRDAHNGGVAECRASLYIRGFPTGQRQAGQDRKAQAHALARGTVRACAQDRSGHYEHPAGLIDELLPLAITDASELVTALEY